MSVFSYIRIETDRLFRSRSTWLVAILTACCPLFGYAFYQPAMTTTRASQLLANPVLAGTLGATILFALLTIYELNRAQKSETDVLVEAVVSPFVFSAARLCAMLLVATATGIAILLIYFPYTAIRMGNVFDLWDYLLCYLGLMTLGMWLGCIVAAALFQITRRMDISFVLFAALLLASMSQYFREDFILRWGTPIIPILSDDFSNAQPLMMALYNRLFWLLIFGGLWVFAQLCTRRYGRGLLGSLARNLRKAYLPVLTIVLISYGVTAYAVQPFVNHAPVDVFDDDVEWPDGVTLLGTQVQTRPNFRWKTHHGTATYRMNNTNAEPIRQLMSINCGYKVHSLTINGEPVAFIDLNDDLIRAKRIEFLLPPGRDLEIVVEYGGYPQMWSLSRSFMGGDELERRYVYLTGPAFAPVMEAGWGYGCTIDAEITMPGALVPLIYSTGRTELLSENADGTKTWRLQDDGNMLYLYAGDYVQQDVSTEGMSVQFYYSRKHEAVMERVNIRETLGDVMRYCVENIGPLHFAEDDALKLVQMSAFMFGGYAGNGMSVMGESSFVEEGLSDPLRGASGQEVMAHEIIHQWWGLGRMFSEYFEEETAEWSSEGFTVYSTYRMMKEKFGAEYAKTYYVDVWQEQVDARARDFYIRHPEYLDRLPQQYVDTIEGANDGVLRYCVMPLKILKAAELVGGEERMDEIMKELFTKEDVVMPPYLSYQDFLDACGLTEEALAL